MLLWLAPEIACALQRPYGDAPEVISFPQEIAGVSLQAELLRSLPVGSGIIPIVPASVSRSSGATFQATSDVERSLREM